MFRISFRCVRPYCIRPYSTDSIRLQQWLDSPKELTLSDTLHPERLSNLYITLPTRDGTLRPYREPISSQPLQYGHHLAFFHHKTPESLLRSDGTDGEYCPPEPFTRRMWAGGSMSWDNENPLLISEKVIANSKVTSIQKKGFDRGNPMLFLTQTIDYTMVGKSSPSLVEERRHVYLAQTSSNRPPRNIQDIPQVPDFMFSYRPSLTTLFRFSALTFNAHHIHLDKDYSQKNEGYPERLVHGPLTALMLLESIHDQNPGLRMQTFNYQATNPMVVNRTHSICGKWADSSQKKVNLWCVDEDGIVGMTGTVTCS